MKMIKFLSATLLLLGATSVYAQEKSVTFGVKAGVNISNFAGDDSDGIDSKTGFNIGVTADINIAPKLYLMTGLEYTMKGGKASGQFSFFDEEYDGKITMNLNYLQLPIHIGYKVAVSDKVNIVFRGGPYVAYGVGGKTEVKVPELGKAKTDSFGKERFKSFDFGAGLGAGVEFGKFGVNIGYDFGLAKIMDMEGDPKVRNANLCISVGYKF